MTERQFNDLAVLLTGCVLMFWAPTIDYLIVRCRQLLPSIILQKVLEFADVPPNSRIVSCDAKGSCHAKGQAGFRKDFRTTDNTLY